MPSSRGIRWIARSAVNITTIAGSFALLIVAIAAKFPGLAAYLPDGIDEFIIPATLFAVIMLFFSSLTNAGKIEAVDDAVAQLRVDITGAKTHICERIDANQFYDRLMEAVKNANRSVDLTNLDDAPLQLYQIPDMKRYFELVRSLVREKRQIHFRRIVSIPSREKFDWVVRMINEVETDPNISFQLVDAAPPNFVPALSLQIVDWRKVLIVDPSTALIRTNSRNNLYIEGAEAAMCFEPYYEQLWKSGRWLKDGTRINRALLNEIGRKLGATA